MYLNSEAVGVFPTTGRPQKDPLGRLTTEYNLTSLINTLLDVDGFVITNNINGFDKTSQMAFQFNIKGYIFTIHKIGSLLEALEKSTDTSLSNASNLFASIEIKLDTGSSITSTGDENLNRIQSIVGMDQKKGDYYNYTGLSISPDDPTEDDSTYPKNISLYSLHILEKREDKWYIPEESKIKLKTSRSGDNRSVSIDDGVIE